MLFWAQKHLETLNSFDPCCKRASVFLVDDGKHDISEQELGPISIHFSHTHRHVYMCIHIYVYVYIYINIYR